MRWKLGWALKRERGCRDHSRRDDVPWLDSERPDFEKDATSVRRFPHRRLFGNPQGRAKLGGTGRWGYGSLIHESNHNRAQYVLSTTEYVQLSTYYAHI